MAMTDTQYHQLADDMFEKIEAAIEQAIDEQDADIDIDASGNVLQLEFGVGAKLVINKQEPLHELWVASRFGGFHFAYVDGKWLDQRNGTEFMPFVQDTITQLSGLTLTLV